MRTIAFVISLFIFTISSAYAQGKNPKQILSFQLGIPYDRFGTSHFVGTGIDYSPYRFQKSLFRSKTLFPYFNAGGIYYFGRNVTDLNYRFSYGDYALLTVAAGAIYKPKEKIGGSLLLGPGLGLHSGHSHTLLCGRAAMHFKINDRILFSPGWSILLEDGSDALMSLSLKAGYLF